MLTAHDVTIPPSAVNFKPSPISILVRAEIQTGEKQAYHSPRCVERKHVERQVTRIRVAEVCGDCRVVSAILDGGN